MKTTFKMIVALSVLALGLASSNAYAQAGANGGGRRGAGGPGGGFNAPIPTIDAVTTALMLTPDEVKVITPILADMTKAQTDFTAAQMAYQTGRTADIAKISDALTDTQKPLLAPLFGPGGRRGAAGAAGQGRRGGANGAPPAAAPAPAPGA
jgi:hypothetical protein